jgi:hypothetical protein
VVSERFDALARRLGNATNRRAALKGLLGFGAATVGVARLSSGTDAARRGFAGPWRPESEPCTDGCSETCSCGPNKICIGGLCFAPCIACACGACTLVPGHGSVCSNDVYATDGPCAGICDSGYACDGGSLCLKPCQL